MLPNSPKCHIRQKTNVMYFTHKIKNPLESHQGREACSQGCSPSLGRGGADEPWLAGVLAGNKKHLFDCVGPKSEHFSKLFSLLDFGDF